MPEPSWMTKIRQVQKLTQLQLAERAGISRAYLTQIALSVRMPSVNN